MNKYFKISILFSILFLLFFIPVFAQYKLQVGIPGEKALQPGQTVQSIAEYINSIYLFALGIAGITALGVIVFGAIEYTISAGFPSRQKDAMDRITQAVFGLILLFASWLILYTINPNLVTLKDPDLPPINLEVPQSQIIYTEEQKQGILSASPPNTVVCFGPGGVIRYGGDNKTLDQLMTQCQQQCEQAAKRAGFEAKCVASTNQPP